jgi:oleandomycin transport system permease protein
MIMGFRIETNPMAAAAGIGISIAFALCFCWISVFVGMKARTSGAVQGIMFLIVLPLTFGSNTFVNPDTMPSWLQTFVNVNPISQLVTTVRGLMIGGPVATSLMWTLVWMAILLVVFVPLALRGYRKRA